MLEFGARRTHPAASVDATYAAYVAGCAASSNLAAMRRYGVPVQGTMDHFYVQSAEQVGEHWPDSERAAFARFFEVFPHNSIMLVDTYETEAGIRHAVEATGGKLSGVRLDSNVTPATVARARQLLDELGAPQAKIIVSDGLDEHRVAALAGADGFGVGENITCSPDAAVGVGAVAKLTVNGYGKLTMKLARGTGKATLPGRLQVHRFGDHDLVALAGEAVPSGGQRAAAADLAWPRGAAAAGAAGRARLRQGADRRAAGAAAGARDARGGRVLPVAAGGQRRSGRAGRAAHGRGGAMSGLIMSFRQEVAALGARASSRRP